MDSPNNGKMGVYLTQMFRFWYSMGFMPALGLDDNGSMATAFGRLLRALEDDAWPAGDSTPKDVSDASWCIKNIMLDSMDKAEALLDAQQQQQKQNQDQQSSSASVPRPAPGQGSLRSLAPITTMAGRLVEITVAVAEMLGQVKTAQDRQELQGKQDQGAPGMYGGSGGRWNVFGRYHVPASSSASGPPPPLQGMPLPSRPSWAPGTMGMPICSGAPLPLPSSMTPYSPARAANSKAASNSIDESCLGDTVVLREMHDNYFHGALNGNNMVPEHLFEIVRHLAPEAAFSYTRPIPPENLQTLVCAVAGWALGSSSMQVPDARLESLSYSQLVNMLVLSGTMLHRSAADRATAAGSSRSAFADDARGSTSTVRPGYASSRASTTGTVSTAGTLDAAKPPLFHVLAVAAANADDCGLTAGGMPIRGRPVMPVSAYARPWSPAPPPLRPAYIPPPIPMKPPGMLPGSMNRPPLARPGGIPPHMLPPRWPVTGRRPTPVAGTKKKKKGNGTPIWGPKNTSDSDDSRSGSDSDSDSGSDSDDSRSRRRNRRSRRYKSEADSNSDSDSDNSSDCGSDSDSESDSDSDNDKKRRRHKPSGKCRDAKSGLSKSKGKTSKSTTSKKSKRGKKGGDDSDDDDALGSDWDAISEKSVTIDSASDLDSDSAASSDSDTDSGSDSDSSRVRRKSKSSKKAKKSKAKRKHRSSRKADASDSEVSDASGSEDNSSAGSGSDSVSGSDDEDADYYSDDNPAATRDGFTRWFIDGLEKARKEAIKEAKGTTKKSKDKEDKAKGKKAKSKADGKDGRSKVKRRGSFVVVDKD